MKNTSDENLNIRNNSLNFRRFISVARPLSLKGLWYTNGGTSSTAETSFDDVYLGCWILDVWAIEGLVLYALSTVGVSFFICLERVRASGNVATGTTIFSRSIGSPSISLGSTAVIGVVVGRVFFAKRTPCPKQNANARHKTVLLNCSSAFQQSSWKCTCQFYVNISTIALKLTATRAAFAMVFFIVFLFPLSFCGWLVLGIAAEKRDI